MTNLMTIESIRIAVARGGRDPEYGDEFWKVSGPAAAAFLLGVIDGFQFNHGGQWALVDGTPMRVQPTYPAEP